MKTPSVFDVDDYRVFLKAWIQAQTKPRGWSSRLAAHLGVNTTLVSQILTGRRDFTLEQAAGTAELLGLSEVESEYWLGKVELSRAGTPGLRKLIRKRLARLKREGKRVAARIPTHRSLQPEEKAEFYSSADYQKIRLACSLEGLASAAEISDFLTISLVRVQSILEFLIRTGLIRSSSLGLELGEAQTHIEAGSPLVVQHHRNWRLEAMNRAERLSDDELMFTAPLTLSRKNFSKWRERFVQLVAELSDEVQADEEPQILASFHLDWIKSSFS